jgi:alkylated DNA repair protein (DNA oxidative demethylase)
MVRPAPEVLLPGAILLRGFSLSEDTQLLAALAEVTSASPFRHMKTSGGASMSVAMTNCGPQGWIADRHGYRYSTNDPQTGRLWPRIPTLWMRLAQAAALQAGFKGFRPDACRIDRYEPGAEIGLHQDKEEVDQTQPIICFSLGVPATFQLGGLSIEEQSTAIALEHGDVLVLGGPARSRFYGALPLVEATHSLLGQHQICLTFRKAV